MAHKVLPGCLAFLVRFFFKDDLAEQLIPDLEIDYEDIRQNSGKFASFTWVLFQCTGILFSGIRNKLFWSLVIFKENIKIAFRNLQRYKKYSVLNIFGLSIGLACSVIIILYVNHELTYDRFHPDADRIYRINLHKILDTGDFHQRLHCTPLADKVRTELPQVEIASRFRDPLENSKNVLFLKNDTRSFENRIYYTDPEFFQIFNVEFISGSPETALNEPNSVVLTESMAKKYFGDENPYGENIEIELDYDYHCPVRLEEFKVTGIVKDSPSNSHIQYNALVSFSTMLSHVPALNEDWVTYHGAYTYVKLNKGSLVSDVENSLIAIGDIIQEQLLLRYGATYQLYELYLQPVTQIHMNSPCKYELEPSGNMYYVYIYSLIALLILTIGCMNYMNLSASIYSTRIREIGIRKVIGANRSGLSGQFLSESFVVTGIAFFFALFISTIFFPIFNDFAGTSLSLSDLLNPKAILATFLLYIIVSTGSAIYPATILTAYQPVSVLKGKLSHKSAGSHFQRLMVFGQFVVSIFLIISTITVFRQLNYMRSQALGFEREQKVVLPVKSNRLFFMRNSEAVKNEFLKLPGVVNATVSSDIPGANHCFCYTKRLDIPDGKRESMNIVTIDFDFIDTYGLEIAAGRGLDVNNPSDIREAMILNEAAVKKLGFASSEEAIGKQCWGHYHGANKTIVGVLKDFHFCGMQDEINPIRFEIENSLLSYITLTLSTDKIEDTVNQISEAWETPFKDIPFEYFFLDESYDLQYRYEMQAAKILSFITISGLVISLLGLLGLASFITRQKEKEIGIRKVLGASGQDIINLLSRQFLIVISVSFVIASFAGWWMMERWLLDFAYRIHQNPFIIIAVGLITLVLALLTVGLHGLKVSHCNPIESIRNE